MRQSSGWESSANDKKQKKKKKKRPQVRNKFAAFPSTGKLGETCVMDFGQYEFHVQKMQHVALWPKSIRHVFP